MTVAGLPAGVTASLTPDATTTGSSTLAVTAANSAGPAKVELTISGKSGNLSHTVQLPLAVTEVLKGTVPVDLSGAYNATGIYSDGSTSPAGSSLDGVGASFSAQLLGRTQIWDGVVFNLGPADAPDVVTSGTVTLPTGKFESLKMLAVGVEGNHESQLFTVTYSDGTSRTSSQSLSDWYTAMNFSGEAEAARMPYRLEGDGALDHRTFHVYGYTFRLDGDKTVRSFTLPSNPHVLVLAITMLPPRDSK